MIDQLMDSSVADRTARPNDIEHNVAVIVAVTRRQWLSLAYLAPPPKDSAANGIRFDRPLF